MFQPHDCGLGVIGLALGTGVGFLLALPWPASLLLQILGAFVCTVVAHYTRQWLEGKKKK